MQVPENMEDVSKLEENAMFRFALESDELFISGIRQDFMDFENGKDMSLHDYVHQLTEDNGMTDAVHNDRNGYVYLYFEMPLADGVHTYLCGAYRAAEGFWLIQIDSLRVNFDEEQAFKYLDSVEFN